MASFQLLDPHEEDALHKTRLLNVEERAFKRITKRLLTPGSLLTTALQSPTPPPENSSADDDAAAEAEAQKLLDERRQFHQDMLLDFAAFDASIARIQFLQNSNEAERARYATEKVRILEAAQAVKDNTAQLRLQLDEAKATLEKRKKFDELANKIFDSRLLRARSEQAVNLRKLEEECRELEKESKTYAETWVERREQFGKIVEEGMRLRSLIRDEKEEVERREGMDGEDEDGEVGDGSRGGQTPRGGRESGGATPAQGEGHAMDEPVEPARREGLRPRPMPAGSLSAPGSRATSRSRSRGRGSGGNSREGSRVPGSRAGSRAGSHAGSRAASPAFSETVPRETQEEGEMEVDKPEVDKPEGEDLPMEDSIPSVVEPQPVGEEAETAATSAADTPAADTSAAAEDKMDTT